MIIVLERVSFHTHTQQEVPFVPLFFSFPSLVLLGLLCIPIPPKERGSVVHQQWSTGIPARLDHTSENLLTCHWPQGS
jgi:hypothetical protein